MSEIAPFQPTGQELVVAPDGSTPFRTITAAIDAANPGDTVVIRPGIYREALVVDKPLELLGGGFANQVVVQADGDNALYLNADTAVIRDLTLKTMGTGDDDDRFPTVFVAHGQPVIEGCHISSDEYPAVAIEGSTANATFRDCVIANDGLELDEGATGTFERCEITQGYNGGVRIGGGADPVFRGCRIHGNEDTGVHVYAFSRGTFIDCEISGNTRSGVTVVKGSAPVFSGCRIQDNEESGVILLLEAGAPTFENCRITGNVDVGIWVESTGAPIVRRCTIAGGGKGGVFIREQGRGLFEDCDISGFELSGVEVCGKGNPTFRRCQIHDNGSYGIHTYEKAEGLFEDCVVVDNEEKDVQTRWMTELKRVKHD